jgi:hypothetical protein
MKAFIFLLTLLTALCSNAQTKILTTGESHVFAAFVADNPVVQIKGGLTLPLWRELENSTDAIAVVGTGFAITPDFFFKAYDFAPTEKFEPIAKLYCMDTIIATGKNSGLKSWADVRSSKRQLNVAIIAGSSVSTAIIKTINEHYNTDLNIVPYSTYAQYKVDMMGGHIDLGITESSLFGAEFATGDLVPLLNLGEGTYVGVEKMRNRYNLPFQFCYYAFANRGANQGSHMQALKGAEQRVRSATDGVLAHVLKVFQFDRKALKDEISSSRAKYKMLADKLGIQPN